MLNRLLISLYLCACLLLAGAYGMILMLPLRIIEIGGTAQDVGHLQMLIGLGAIGTILLSGRISDRIGSLKTMTVAALLIALALEFFVLGDSLNILLFLASILFGIGWGLFFVFKLVVLAKLTDEANRFRLYSYLAIAIMSGFGLWPVWGAKVLEITNDISLVFHISSLGCLVAGGLLYFLVRHLVFKTSKEHKAILSLSALVSIRKSDAALPILVTFLSACIFAGMSSFQTLIADKHGLDYSEYFLSYTCSVILFRLCFANKVQQRNAYQTICILFIMLLVSVVLFSIMELNQTLYILIAILFGIGYGGASPLVQTLGANEAPANLISQSLQLLVLAHLCGIFGFPLIAGILITHHGLDPLLFCLTGLSIFIFTITLFRTFQKQKRKNYDTTYK